MPRALRRLALFAAVGYAGWLAMMATHEFGHVLHAWATGGTVVRVVVPMFGFSRTDVSPNPRPLVVAWGGPVWGCAIPLVLTGLFDVARWRGRLVVRFFAGLCLVANGVYLGVGWTTRAGDAGDLVRLGTPVWVLVSFGVVATGAGLLLWHRCGREGDVLVT
jgi:hypothetical protein